MWLDLEAGFWILPIPIELISNFFCSWDDDVLG